MQAAPGEAEQGGVLGPAREVFASRPDGLAHAEGRWLAAVGGRGEGGRAAAEGGLGAGKLLGADRGRIGRPIVGDLQPCLQMAHESAQRAWLGLGLGFGLGSGSGLELGLGLGLGLG